MRLLIHNSTALSLKQNSEVPFTHGSTQKRLAAGQGSLMFHFSRRTNGHVHGGDCGNVVAQVTNYK